MLFAYKEKETFKEVDLVYKSAEESKDVMKALEMAGLRIEHSCDSSNGCAPQRYMLFYKGKEVAEVSSSKGNYYFKVYDRDSWNEARQKLKQIYREQKKCW